MEVKGIALSFRTKWETWTLQVAEVRAHRERETGGETLPASCTAFEWMLRGGCLQGDRGREHFLAKGALWVMVEQVGAV
jgi:hypothetical protein